MQHDVFLSAWQQFLHEYNISKVDTDMADFLPYAKSKSFKKGDMIARIGDEVQLSS